MFEIPFLFNMKLLCKFPIKQKAFRAEIVNAAKYIKMYIYTNIMV